MSRRIRFQTMLNWKDGLPFSDRYGDVYFSADSGLEEKRHVFLQGNRLAERCAALSAGDSFCIAETGFGTGLNFLCAWQLFEQTAASGASLDFFSVERFPLEDDELRAALALWPELHVRAEALRACWRRRVPGWNRWSFAGGRVRLTLVCSDVAEALPQLPKASVDAWFLDGFSPARNPEMWSDEVMANIARAARAGATLATYTSAGWVRRGLQQAGFEVEIATGFGHKREMLRGLIDPDVGAATSTSSGQASAANDLRQQAGSYTRKTPRTAIIIGGGIAGCAAAHALAQRDIAVTLVERAPQLASAASGNPRGILHARFGAGDNVLHRFVLAAYGHALGLLDEVLPVDGVLRAECGLLQLACNDVESKRIARLAQQEWPRHLLQFVDAAQASRLAGVEMGYGGLWFPAGGWVVPPRVCEALVSDARITVGLGQEAEGLEKIETGWLVSGRYAQGKVWSAEADIVVVCCAHTAKTLGQFAHFPLIPVRGQITEVPQSQDSKALRSVVCGDGYCAPAVQGVHVTGATHAFDDESTEVRDSDHIENLKKLGEYAPDLLQLLYPDHSSGSNPSQPPLVRGGVDRALPLTRGSWRGLGSAGLSGLSGRASIRCSAPGSIPLVGEVQQGLYCSLAHGTRGLLTAGLAGEVLAAQVRGELPPLPTKLLAALAPLPRVRHQG